MSREFKEYENENGARVRAHVVTEETQGHYQAVDGTGQTVGVGQVLVEAGRPGVYDVTDAKGFKDAYKEDKSADTVDVPAENDGTPDEGGSDFDPSEHTAAEVKAYLDSVRGTDEYARVSAAEREGKNRGSALA